ncbi:MAG: hypothetical protein ACFFB7_08975, partial [Candidatus Sifarchaeia archaeon]
MLGFLLAPTRWFWDGDVRGLHEVRFKRSPRICHSDSLLRVPVHVFEDGYVVLGTKNRRIAVERGNALQFSIGLLTGAPSEPVTERSLENIVIDDGEREFTGRNSLCQLRNVFSVDEDMRKEWEAGLMGRVFDIRELPIVFDFSNKILGFHTPSLATRHLETSYHFVMGDWTASLLLGWSLIEQVLDEEFTLRHMSEGKSRKS